MSALDCILNLREVLYQYFVKYISATAALYFKVLLFWNDNFQFFVKSISIPDGELFSETYVDCTASYFV